MKTKPLIVAVMCFCCILCAFGWGKKGHDVTAAIAERHLSPQAKTMMSELLDGKSIIYWANWLDNASYTPEFRHTKTWHYKNVNEGVRYEEMGVNSSGDAVLAIKAMIETLTDSTKSKEDKSTALKILVHLVGDMHQPLHMGHATDLGGNRIKVKFFDRDTNLHSVWDDALPEAAHKWSYTEWSDQIDRLTPEQEAVIVFPASYETAGGFSPKLIDEWAKQTVEIADKVYKKMPAKTTIKYDEIAWAAPIIEDQVLAAGLRLAYLLNMIAEQ